MPTADGVFATNAGSYFFGVKVVNARGCDGKVDILKGSGLGGVARGNELEQSGKASSLRLLQFKFTWLIKHRFEPDGYAADGCPSLFGEEWKFGLVTRPAKLYSTTRTVSGGE